MKAGDTFLRGGVRKHLWVVISDPAANPDDPVVIVCLTTYHPRDFRLAEACVLMPEDHRFVKHKTVVHYGMTQQASNADLDDRIKRHLLDCHDPVRPDVLERIRTGAAVSKHISRGCRALLVSQKLI